MPLAHGIALSGNSAVALQQFSAHSRKSGHPVRAAALRLSS
jgi:hypothetical protein